MRYRSTHKPQLNEEEQHVFDLLGEGLSTQEITDRLGISKGEAATIIYRVVKLRGTPNLEAIREGLERFEKINFV